MEPGGQASFDGHCVSVRSDRPTINSSLSRKVIGRRGDKNVIARPPIMGGEDFSRYGRAGVPIFLYFLGTVAPERVAAAAKEGAQPLPSLHSDQFYPVPEPSIRTGVLTMSMAVLNLVGK